MKFFPIALGLLLTLSSYSLAQETKSTPAEILNLTPKKVYVIPVKNEIEDALTFLIRRGVKEAIRDKADILVLHMDTPGGKVSSTLDILKILEKFPNQSQTYTFIDPWAISAGALISSGTRNIYMSPTAIIGAAAPVMSSPGGTGGPQQMPSTMEEKMNSALRAQIRALAERNGHRPEVFNAMVDKDQGLTIDGKEIVPKGKIVTLTAQESLQQFGGKPLLSKGTFENLDAFISHIAGPGAIITKVEPTGFEAVGRFIVMLSPILLGAAVLCGYIEFKTPGFGILGSIAVICALIFFFGHYVAGLSGYEFALLFILGLALIAVELFVFPGTLIPGLVGLALVGLSLLKAMVDRYPTDPFLPSAAQLELPLTNLMLSLTLGVAGILLLARLFPKTPLYSKMVLTPSPAMASGKLPPLAHNLKIGAEGISLTYLRPCGTADFGDGPIDVLTEGIYIQAHQPLRILQIEGTKITVEAL